MPTRRYQGDGRNNSLGAALKAGPIFTGATFRGGAFFYCQNYLLTVFISYVKLEKEAITHVPNFRGLFFYHNLQQQYLKYAYHKSAGQKRPAFH